jgi:hypothetical protein
VLREVPGLREFQVVQEALDHIRVRVVPQGELSAGARTSIAGRIGALFEGGARIEVEIADSVTSASGKHRYVISHVADARVNALVGAA